MTYDIHPKRTALLLIDPQREYFDEGAPLYTPNAEPIRERLVALRQAARRSGTLTVLVRHVFARDRSNVGRMGDFNPTRVFVEGTAGVDFIEEMQPRREDLVISKTRYSAFVGTLLDRELRNRDIDTVVVAGLMTSYCSVSTARHAHDLDYRVIFVVDANAGPDMPDLGFGEVSQAEMLRAVSTSLAGGVADVTVTAEVVARLSDADHSMLVRSGTR